MKNKKVLYLTQAAMIAALYVVLTMIANALGIASGNIQVRFSEALTVLPFFSPAAIPGLYIGCLIANVVTGAALPDIIFGPLATLIGAIGTWALGKAARRCGEGKKAAVCKWLSPLPPILANAVVVPPVLKYAYGIVPVWFSVITVTAGEIISCGIFGLILLFALQKYKNQLFGLE
ncbi:MAG: QueT transporter family protein [Eubacteriales bacterium]|nr:QueT transporter family protein [Eubacteriales bacterium]